MRLLTDSEESRGVFPVKLVPKVLRVFPGNNRAAAMDFYIRKS